VQPLWFLAEESRRDVALSEAGGRCGAEPRSAQVHGLEALAPGGMIRVHGPEVLAAGDKVLPVWQRTGPGVAMVSLFLVGLVPLEVDDPHNCERPRWPSGRERNRARQPAFVLPTSQKPDKSFHRTDDGDDDADPRDHDE
jgi:hypothetical protein